MRKAMKTNPMTNKAKIRVKISDMISVFDITGLQAKENRPSILPLFEGRLYSAESQKMILASYNIQQRQPMNKKALSLFALSAIILAGCTTKPNMNTVASKSGASTSSHGGASTTKISVSNPDNLAAPQAEIVKGSTWLGYAVKVTNTNSKPEFVRCYYEKDD